MRTHGPLAQLVPAATQRRRGAHRYVLLHYGPLAQLVERFHGMEEVNGSIPLRSIHKSRGHEHSSAARLCVHSRKTESAHAMLLRDKTPECLEPESEWYTTVTEDGACRHRNITTTLLALQDVAADCPHVRLCTMGASRDSVPTDLCYVLPTCLVRGELIDEILRRLRILYCHASV